jgi:hypothetical protein
MPARTTETTRIPEDLSGRQRRIPVGGITWRHTFRALRIEIIGSFSGVSSSR